MNEQQRVLTNLFLLTSMQHSIIQKGHTATWCHIEQAENPMTRVKLRELFNVAGGKVPFNPFELTLKPETENEK